MRLEDSDIKRMRDLFDHYERDEIDIDMKFPEATAWNCLIDFEENLLDPLGQEGWMLFELCCQVLENSNLIKKPF